MAARARSNVDHTRLISKSIFVTNFPDNTTSKDLWEVCKGYGTVVDVFIPDRKSKAGKRFAFVRFIKVDNVDRLVALSPAMVLDDECVVERDLDNFVIGEVKDFSSINNLRVLLSNEGFQHVRLAYLGGLWVMIELTSMKDKEVDDYSEDDSVNGAEEINGDISKQMNLDDETDIEGVSDTVFDDKAESWGMNKLRIQSQNEKENSSNPFNLYNLLNKRDKGEANSGLDSSIPFPPGFTPEREFQHVDAQEGQGMENSLSKRRSKGLSSRVLEDAQPLNEHASPSIDSKKKQFTGLRFKKKLQILKKEIRSWVNDCKKNQSGRLVDLRSKLCHIDKVIDQGGVNDDILLTRLDLLKKLHDIKSSDARDYMQKAKIQWAIEGDENSNFFHGIINRKRANLAIKGVMVDGEWVDDPCRHKKQQAMVFKVDFAKAYDSIRWDFLEDVLRAFGFGSKWCSWIRGCLHSGDPLAPYLFILIMESLHLSLSRAIEAGIFKGIKIGSSLNISYLFYADDAVFIGEWSIANLSGITHILHCFSLLSGLSINLKKSHLLGVGIRSEDVNAAALYFGCSTMKTPFKYLGVMVGGNSSTLQAWDDTIGKLKARLSNWKT
ncbi:RNA-directed DNA polymerase, eukaryota [Tanacetum coccineum]